MSKGSFEVKVGLEDRLNKFTLGDDFRGSFEHFMGINN